MIEYGGLHSAVSKKGKQYQYILVKLEILDEEGVLVAAFFFYNERQEKPDPLLGKLLTSVQMCDDYRGEENRFFDDLVGRKVRVKIDHKYKSIGGYRERREQVVDFEPIDGKLIYKETYDTEDLSLEDESNFPGKDQSGVDDSGDIPF